MKFAVLLALLLVQNVFASDAFRTIAILENERMLVCAPNTQLADFFKNPSADVRARAVIAAARIGDKATLPAISKLVNDSNPHVRESVAFALGQIRAKEGLVAAIDMLKDSDSEVRRLAIEAIGRIGGIEVTSSVVPFLEDRNLPLREQAGLALALIKDKATVEKLMQLSEGEDPAQWSYVYALYRLADERSIPVLHHVIAKPVPSPSTGDPSSLLFALKALWSMKAPLTAEETEMLLKNPDPRVQENSLDVLAAANDKTVCPILQKSYPSMNANTKTKALEAMGALGCVIEQRPESPLLLGAWIAAKAKSEKEKALPFLVEGVKNDSWIVRWRTAQALADLPEATSAPLLKPLISDSDSAVRLAALDSLSKFMPSAAELFIPLLESKDFAIRATAADALGKTKDPKYLSLLIKAYDSSHDPAEIEGRTAVLDALPDFHSSETLKIFEDALFDPEVTIRRHAIDGLKKMMGAAPFFFQGKTKDLEEFLFLKGNVSAKRMNEYPPDFGAPAKPVEVMMKLEKGMITIRLLNNDAPLHTENFLKLVQRHFYDGLRIHRVVPNFVIQGGDPRGDGWGGAGEVVHDQVNTLIYKRGMVGMPIAGKDTGGSQFFITESRQPHLDGNYTIFGEVISGMEVVDQTEIGDKILSVEIRK
jgi:HEAT repeat protein/cyclophilin family peptidyl-prolyl cis-trans isomerase